LKVFGIDIIKGSVRSRTKKPVFALARREDGKLTQTEEASLYRLIRVLNKEKPDILAVDSTREVSKNQQELIFFMQSLPAGTKLVQVTGGERQESLPRVAARYNIKLSDRFDPFSEAKTSAHVAELGAGCEVVAFENSCDIVVSRSRSIGKGGWSQNRYIRKIHGSVLLKAREIEDILREKGFRYDKKESKGFGGLKRVSFHVCAAKNEISVQSEKHSDFQVRVSARKLDRIKYLPQTVRKRPVIVGIDPGTTFGFAAVSLDGELVALKSSRQMSLSDWTEEISSAGKPVVIASDIAKMPASVEKIRRAFKAVSYTPKEDRTQD
jgi:predicted RNase H-like nuclease (RuvC/YqgF family)